MESVSQNLGDLIELLELVVQDGMSHDLKKGIMLNLHKTKSASRQNRQADLTLVLLDIEECLGFGKSDPTIDTERLEAFIVKLNGEPEKQQADDYDIEFHPATKHAPAQSVEEVHTEPAQIHLTICNCTSRDEARDIARGLVENGLAACVNVIANIGSVYSWQGEIHDTTECQLQIKSAPELDQKIQEFIIEKHSNEVPEIISVPISKGNQSYFDWVKEETQ